MRLTETVKRDGKQNIRHIVKPSRLTISLNRLSTTHGASSVLVKTTLIRRFVEPRAHVPIVHKNTWLVNSVYINFLFLSETCGNHLKPTASHLKCFRA